jgi:hypothetical protein
MRHPRNVMRIGKAIWVREWQTSSVHFEEAVTNFSRGFDLGVDMIRL